MGLQGKQGEAGLTGSQGLPGEFKPMADHDDLKQIHLEIGFQSEWFIFVEINLRFSSDLFQNLLT